MTVAPSPVLRSSAISSPRPPISAAMRRRYSGTAASRDHVPSTPRAAWSSIIACSASRVATGSTPTAAWLT